MSKPSTTELDEILAKKIPILGEPIYENGKKYYQIDVAPLKQAIEALIAEKVREALRLERKARKLGKKRRLETEARIKLLPKPLPQSPVTFSTGDGTEAEEC